MDTTVTIKIYTSNKSVGREKLKAAFEEGRRIETIMEPLKGDGELQLINKDDSGKWIPISPELRTVIARAKRFHELSDGAFDPTIAPVKWLWNFENGGILPDKEQIEECMRGVGFQHVHLSVDSLCIDDPATKLDLGGIAKGYAVDRMITVLKVAGVTAGLVNAGGDIATFGKKPGGEEWVIGLSHPRMKRTLIIGDIPLDAVATSGDYERYFMHDGERYHHILNPANGYPARGSISVTTWTTSAMDADLLSTAIFVLGPEKGVAFAAQLENVETLVFYERDGAVKAAMTEGVKGKIAL